MPTERLLSDHVRVFEQHIRENCKARLLHIYKQCDDNKSHFGVNIDLGAMMKPSQETVLSLLDEPIHYLPLLQAALDTVYDELVREELRNQYTQHTDDDDDEDDDDDDQLLNRPNLHARVSHLPTMTQWVKPNISVLRSSDVGKLISIMGTVTRTGSVALREHRREYACKRCKHSFDVFGDVSQRGEFEMPARCPGSTADKPCYSSQFALIAAEGSLPECREYQEIKLQEKVQNLNVGSIPRSIICVLTDDLSDCVKPGDDVIISGIIHLRWLKQPTVGSRVDIDLMMIAEHVKTSNERKSFMHVTEESHKIFVKHWNSTSPEDQLKARNLILKSICPRIYGMYLVKLIVAMTLIGGVPHTDNSGTRIRGESHLLMVGDPGTAKSQFLRYAAKMSPRSVLTTGIGTTSAGLTVTAVREPGTGEWMLDAGALVLADGGICCIDEFDGIKTHDRGAIHEAMEQQTLSIAKAGLVCTMNTRATVMAAVNPKTGRVSTAINGGNDSPDEYADEYDSDGGGHGNLPITVGIAAPLLSRFDVILTLMDHHNEEWDKKLSSFILNDYVDMDEQTNNELWSADRLKQYVYFVKTNLQPTLSDDARTLITAYYTKERAVAKRNAARTTVRLLEALVRLAQSHARLMFRQVATAMDATFAIAAVECSTEAPSIVGGVGALHASFPDDPEKEFDSFARTVLLKLGLEDAGIHFYKDNPSDGEDEEGGGDDNVGDRGNGTSAVVNLDKDRNQRDDGGERVLWSLRSSDDTDNDDGPVRPEEKGSQQEDEEQKLDSMLHDNVSSFEDVPESDETVDANPKRRDNSPSECNESSPGDGQASSSGLESLGKSSSRTGSNIIDSGDGTDTPVRGIADGRQMVHDSDKSTVHGSASTCNNNTEQEAEEVKDDDAEEEKEEEDEFLSMLND